MVYHELVKKFYAIPTIDHSDLVKKADYDTKIEDIKKKISNHDKYINTSYSNEFPAAIFDERFKQAILATNNDVNTVEKRTIGNDKKHLIQVVFLVKNFFGGDCFQNMFVSEPKFSSLDMKKMVNIIFLLGNQKEYKILNEDHYTILYLSLNILQTK